MKKFHIACVVVLTLLLSTTVPGCAKVNLKQPGQDTAKQPPAVKKQELIIGVDGMTGDYYIGSGIAAILNKHLDYIDVQCKEVTRQSDYLQKLSEGEFNLGVISSSLADDLRNKTGLSKIKAEPGFQMVTPLYAKVFQCLVKKNSGLKKLYNIKGHKVVVGPQDSDGEKLTRALLAACGITYNDFTPYFYSYPDAVKEFAKGNVDCVITNEMVPSSVAAELSANIDTTILTIDDNNIDKILKTKPFYEAITIVPRTYKGLEEYIPTVSTTALLVVCKNLDKDLVYTITKTLYENLSELESFHPLGKELKPGYENSILQPLTFHPGASQYFVEQQMIRPETIVRKE